MIGVVPSCTGGMSIADFQIPGYEIQRRLGEGGMATVYLALQRSLDRRVAIKVMRRRMSDETEEKRFLNEGRTLARLPHPNIVGVYDIVQTDELSYIAMEYLEGGVLSERMKVGISLAEAIGIVVQIADALQFAHDSGVIHRDLKPANILFRGRNTPVLTDFGIARLQNLDATRLTQSGMMIGTPAYMSPEQAQGGTVDGRSDQYALGVLFYELLARRLPFSGETAMQIAYQHVNAPPPPLPLRFDFAQPLMDKMLAKDPKDRFPDLKTFARELKSIVTNNQGLQDQLQVNPGHSVSEKLRALGFSEDQIHTSGVSRGATVVNPKVANPKVKVAAKDVPPELLAHQLLEHSNLKLEPLEKHGVILREPSGEPHAHHPHSAHSSHSSHSQMPAALVMRNVLIGVLVFVAVLLALKFLPLN